FQEVITRHLPHRWPIALVFIFQLLVGVYGGYFGAGMGILMLAALGLIGLTDLHQMNGLKNLLAICINAVAAIYFAASGAVIWFDAILMAIAAILGGFAGAKIAHKLGRKFVRAAIVIIGLGMTIALFLKR
ncbi:MAG TPA: sulfite exporter TauE/SafE family protein, partial [Thermoanaerobaculia bacterium]|nr:sulfite exporter TauE/SafE family protein [Thermoanaerobaculia bacterium]